MKNLIMYKVKCAWCNKDMGEKFMETNAFAIRLIADNKPVISHGICEDCKTVALAGIRSTSTTKEGALCSTQV